MRLRIPRLSTVAAHLNAAVASKQDTVGRLGIDKKRIIVRSIERSDWINGFSIVEGQFRLDGPVPASGPRL